MIPVNYSSLPPEMKMDIMIRVPYPQVLSICATDRDSADICNDSVFWSHKAVHDFPETSVGGFNLIGDPDLTSKERYETLRSYIPTKDNLRLLNILSVQWSVSNSRFDFVIDPLIDPTIYYADILKNEKPMTEEEVSAFLEHLEDEIELDSPFTPSNHVYLTTTFRRYPRDSNALVTTRMTTLVRGDFDNGVTHGQILTASRTLFPSNANFNEVKEYEFDGFSEDGIPIVKVDIDF